MQNIKTSTIYTDVPVEAMMNTFGKFNPKQKIWDFFNIKVKEDQIVMDKEAFLKAIGDAFDAGAENEYENSFGTVPTTTVSKEQYLNNLINQ